MTTRKPHKRTSPSSGRRARPSNSPRVSSERHARPSTSREALSNQRKRPSTSRQHVRPRVSKNDTGARGLVPKSTFGRVFAAVVIAIIVAVMIFNGSVAATSIPSPNYYDDPTDEFRADVIDTVADTMKAVTPDSSNPHIDAVRESLTGRSKWTNTVIDAEQYWGLDTNATKLVIGMINVESGGDETNVINGNIMQIASGTEAFTYLVNGVPGAGVDAYTPEASIYAGVYVTKNCCDCFTDSFGAAPDFDNIGQDGLLAQGYNYGYEGWITWCARNSITEWSLYASETYQAKYMSGGGTVNHGQKVMNAIEAL